MIQDNIIDMLKEGSTIIEFFGIRKTTYNVVEQDGSKWKITSAQFNSLENKGLIKCVNVTHSGFTKRIYTYHK